MAEVVRSPQAVRDIFEIFDQGMARWGAVAAFDYSESFDTVWNLLERHPNAGRPREELGPGMRSWRHRSHIVYYLATESTVLIARVLHMAADPHDAFD